MYNPVMHARTKHLEDDYHYVREKVVRKELDIRYICSNDHAADVFTKGLSTPRFEKLKAKLMVLQWPTILQGCINQAINPPDHPPNQAKLAID